MPDIIDQVAFEYDPIREQSVIEDLTEIYLQNEALGKYFQVNKNWIKFRHFAGIVQTDRFKISIFPKIWERSSANRYAFKGLMRLLLYTYLSPAFLEDYLDLDGSYEQNDLLELLIMLFAVTLERELTQGIYRNYVRSSEVSGYLRGKLRLERQLNRIDKSKFDIEDFRFTPNNDLNNYLVYATSFFHSIANGLQNVNNLAILRRIFLEENVGGYLTRKQINFNRLNERFRIPYNYADLILRRISPDLGSGKKVMMMLFDMNVVFQDFVVKFIDEHRSAIFPNKTVTLRPQSRRRNFIFRDQDALKFTIPDLLIEFEDGDSKNVILLDMKYKIINEVRIDTNESNDEIFNITESDLYQMFTYSELYKPKCTILLFPGPVTETVEQLAFTQNGESLLIWRINLDLMDDNWENKLVEGFKGLFDSITSLV